MSSIQLNFITLSNDPNNSSIVIFQGNPNQERNEEQTIAWRVIRNCGKGWSYPFTFSSGLSLIVTDPFGNVSPPVEIQPGQEWDIIKSDSGSTSLVLNNNPNVFPGGIVVSNRISGAITATICRDGKAMNVQSIHPNFTYTYEFTPLIGMATTTAPAEEGSPIIVTGPVYFSLDKIGQADIIMTGGGESGPLKFTITNEILAG